MDNHRHNVLWEAVVEAHTWASYYDSVAVALGWTIKIVQTISVFAMATAAVASVGGRTEWTTELTGIAAVAGLALLALDVRNSRSRVAAIAVEYQSLATKARRTWDTLYTDNPASSKRIESVIDEASEMKNRTTGVSTIGWLCRKHMERVERITLAAYYQGHSWASA